MGLIYPDDMISIPFLSSPQHGGLAYVVSVLFAVRPAALIYAMAGRPPGVLGSFPYPPSIAIYFLHVFSGSFQVSLHFMDIRACVPGSLCIRRLCIPFLLSFFFLHPDFHYMICCVLKTSGVYYGLMYVKISLP